ncbi:phosphotransferase [Novosphingobium colocasiae]
MTALGGVLPPYARIAAWLEANVPEPSGATIIHNDLRLGNVMWAPQAPARIAAILDWELATVGDPLLDLAYLVCSAPREGATHTPVQDLSAALIAPPAPPRARRAGGALLRLVGPRAGGHCVVPGHGPVQARHPLPLLAPRRPRSLLRRGTRRPLPR